VNNTDAKEYYSEWQPSFHNKPIIEIATNGDKCMSRNTQREDKKEY
jgi:hypothetical protein